MEGGAISSCLYCACKSLLYSYSSENMPRILLGAFESPPDKTFEKVAVALKNLSLGLALLSKIVLARLTPKRFCAKSRE